MESGCEVGVWDDDEGGVVRGGWKRLWGLRESYGGLKVLNNMRVAVFGLTSTSSILTATRYNKTLGISGPRHSQHPRYVKFHDIWSRRRERTFLARLVRKQCTATICAYDQSSLKI